MHSVRRLCGLTSSVLSYISDPALILAILGTDRLQGFNVQFHSNDKYTHMLTALLEDNALFLP